MREIAIRCALGAERRDLLALPRLDAVTMIAVPLLLSAVILAACLRPVRRAARVNPIDVLRAL